MYERRLDGLELNFASLPGNKLIDRQSGSEWSAVTGECLAGKHSGRRLKEHIAIVSYDRVWYGFYPTSTRYRGGE
ncbi:MAG TPA: hypothetical protein DDW98_04510 [Gammaproteobacteria bacterium]|nr:hypothetical protein [Gammaproteobacteria bacterium]